MQFNFKQFIAVFLIIVIVFFAFDILVDVLGGSFNVNEIFGLKNILIKLAAGIVAGAIFATSSKKDAEKK